MSEEIPLELKIEEIQLLMSLLNYSDPTSFFVKPVKEKIDKQVKAFMDAKNDGPKV